MSIDWLLALAACACVSSCSCSASDVLPDRRDGDPQAERLQREGIELVDARELDQAGARLEAAYRSHVRLEEHAAAAIDACWLMRRYVLESDYRAALRWGDLAHTQAVASGEDEPLGKVLLGLVGVFQSIDDSAASGELLASAERYVPADDLADQARLRYYRGLDRRASGRLAEAEQLQEEALELARAADDQRRIQIVSINLADLALAGHRLDDAERHLDVAMKAWQTRGVPPSPGILVNRAALERARGHLSQAMAALDQAAEGAPPDTLWAVDRDRGITAEMAGRPDEAERRYREAIELIDELRARSAPTAGIANFFVKRWTPFEHLFALQVARGDAPGAFATLARAQGRMFLDELVRTATPVTGTRVSDTIGRMDLIVQLVPVLAVSPLADAGNEDYVLGALRDRHVLTYFVGAGRLRALAIENGEPRITSVDVEVGELERMESELRAHPDDDWAAAELGAALLPADALPAQPGRVHIVPTGVLVKVPFAALKVAGERVLDHYDVAYAPSVASLAVSRPARADGGERSAVLADRRLGLRADDRELRAVIDATGAVAYLDAEATTAALRRAARAPVLHVISHSGVNSRGGFLALEDDQEVTAADIVSWGLRPGLVVLFTCASAGTTSTEMWGSLAAAFLAGGSEHVVATLTGVRDDDASAFAVTFYRNGGAVDPVAGLARAQREMARTRPVSEWSPYIVAGP
ncbi:MAG TPA: CHAT domain-containing protein [Kofleriaceae bacterium]|nr:CHAT domain-containing protein [Kofleriaceae bacterium]